jgi:hypothetical protein
MNDILEEYFPSKYLKAADLGGREIKVIMQNVEREEVGTKDGRPDYKPVLYFKGKSKGVVLNKTNTTRITDHYGTNPDDWFDQPLILYSEMATYAGKTGPAIRCRVPTAKDNKPAKADPISSGRRGDAIANSTDDDMNDDISDVR